MGKNTAELALLALVGLCAVYLWRLLPIYPDEIAFLTWVSRVSFDGWTRLSSTQFCESSSMAPITGPLLLPASLYSIFGLIGRYDVTRMIGLIIGIGIPVIYFMALYKQSRNSICLTATFLFVCGVRPSMVGLLRPESFVIASLMLCAYLVYIQGTITSRLKQNLLAFVVLVAVSMALYPHPKGLYFLPVYMFTLFALLNRRFDFICWTCLLFLTAWFSYVINEKQLFHCPESPSWEAATLAYNINPLHFSDAPLSFVSEIYRNVLSRDYVTLFSKLLFVEKYDAGYLPNLSDAPMAKVANGLLIVAVFITGIAFIACFNLARIKHKSYPWRKTVFCLLVLVSLFLHHLTNKTLTFYEVGFWTSILLLIMPLFGPMADEEAELSFLSAATVVCAFIACLASFYVVGEYMIPHVFNARFAGPDTPILDWHDNAAQYQQIDQTCHVGAGVGRIVHDDATYFLVRKYPKPIAITYALKLGPQEAVNWFRRANVSALVMQCVAFGAIAPFLTAEENQSTYHAGNLCCLRFDQQTKP